MRDNRNTVESTNVLRTELSCGPLELLRARHFSHRFPAHFHDTFAIGVVEQGSTALHTVNGGVIANAGSILAFSPGEIHAADALSENGYTFRMIYPTRAFLQEAGVNTAVIAKGDPLFANPAILDPELAGLLIAAHRPLMSGEAGAGSENRLVGAIRQLVARHGVQTRGDGRHSLRDLDLAARARDYLRERFAEPVRMAELSAACGLSVFHLIRVFRRVVGVPPHAYVVQLRVNHAQAMLSAGAPVAAVANACGFSDQSHLTRVFRKAVGVPPGKYRRAMTQSIA